MKKFQSLEKSEREFPTLGKPRAGFTLVELLAVIGIIAVLAAILFPVLGTARGSADAAKCTSNLRQLQCANVLYASDTGYYVAAAPDYWGTNLKRWHGTRNNKSQSFNSLLSPLAPYLGHSDEIKRCPAFRTIATNGFEAGCGGYGYNECGVGSQSYVSGSLGGVAKGMSPGAIRQPAQTIMFCDAAYPQNLNGATALIEYSFAEPFRQLADQKPEEAYDVYPSIHFRHNGHANVIWCDGHVSQEIMTHSRGGYDALNIGWFGPQDNSLFDPF